MSLSKTHAQFQVVPDGALVVMDRGSTNGSILVRGGRHQAADGRQAGDAARRRPGAVRRPRDDRRPAAAYRDLAAQLGSDAVTFEYTRTVTTTASARDVWALWSDPGSWHAWDPAVESVALEGHFAEGAAGPMVLTGGIEVPVTLEMVEPGARYLDRLEMGDLRIHIDHVVKGVRRRRRGHGEHDHHRPGRRRHRPDGHRRRTEGHGGALRAGRGPLDLAQTSARSPSAAATAASAWIRIESRTGIGESSGPTSSSISVQPSTTASEPASRSRSMMPAYVARERLLHPAEGELVEDDPVRLVALGRARARRR